MSGSAGRGDPAPIAESVYALGSNEAERDRLRRQSEELGAHSARLLDQVDIVPGSSAIDLGCGPRGIIDLLAERVATAGRVVGLELNPDNVTLARRFVNDQRLLNVEVIAGDARRTGLPSSSFDLVHARTLLINVPDPVVVVAEMARLTRPGGWIAALEPDGGAVLCYPAHPGWDRLVEIFRAANQSDGANPYIGRRLPELFRQAGLSDVGVEAKADIYPAGHSRRTLRLDLVASMCTKIIERGIAAGGGAGRPRRRRSPTPR